MFDLGFYYKNQCCPSCVKSTRLNKYRRKFGGILNIRCTNPECNNFTERTDDLAGINYGIASKRRRKKIIKKLLLNGLKRREIEFAN